MNKQWLLKIYVLLEKNKLTQNDVAKSLNTNQATYAHYEDAIYLIPTTFLYNLTKIYKTFSIDELLGRKKNNSKDFSTN